MLPEELQNLVRNIQRQKSETQTIELKTAEHGCPMRLFDSLSSFSNQDEGGIIIFGVSEKDDFSVTGVYDAQDLQKKVTEQCKQMEPPVRALFTLCEFDGKTVVSAEIPATDYSQRPVFYKGVGRIKGSYVRVGESDEPMSEYEIYSYEAFKKRIRDELRVCDNSNFKLMNRERLDEYVQRVETERSNLQNNVSQSEMLEFMGVVQDGRPTLAGMLAFSKYPQAYYPQLCIIAVALPGNAMGEIGTSQERFIDNERITGAIPEMLNTAVEFVRRNSRMRTIINENGGRTDKPEYPIKVIREAILNALVHRDYSIYSENTPIRIEMYRNRIEITNPGSLYGRMTLDSLGHVRPETRNAALANILELLHITENRYSGIPTMRRELELSGLSEPEFSILHGEFKVIIYNDYEMTENSELSIVNFCKIPRTREELTQFTGKSRNYTMTKIIQPLLDQGLLKLTMPDKPKSSLQRYVKA